ncbi:MAG: tetratricopeptide repeat protein [Saprospiraceae bacterium]|nr:tetratricopeptide repeat protein [Saprospiraceae bacterium]
MKKALVLSVLFLFGFLSSLDGQTSKLAMQYFETGEYEKAAQLYKELYAKDRRSTFYFDKYVESLLALDDFAGAEKIVASRLRKEPDNLNLLVTQGKILEAQYNEEDAEKTYQTAIKRLPADRLSIVKLGNEFVKLNKFELAIKTYEKGAKLLKDDIVFSYNLGDLYRRMHDVPKMIHHFLNAVENQAARTDNVKLLMQRYLGGEDWDELQSHLYERLQTHPDNGLYTELLAWVFIQRKDFRNALRQLTALDRRNSENGSRVYDLGRMAENAKDYGAAIKAYEYLVTSKDPASPIYLDAKKDLLNTKRTQITSKADYTRAEMQSLRDEYLAFLEEFGRTKSTGNIMLDLAKLEALHLDDLASAITLLEELVDYPGLNKYLRANAKITLGDYYLMKGERWDATLYYSQVDKEFKDDLLGQTARFRNAKLSYFTGDFQWAQTQFDVLKASTSKLIANDALDLSIFIMDNLGLDTSATALEMYAQSELLVFQNKFDDASLMWEQIADRFPDHSLYDDILYIKAQMLTNQRKYQEAADLFQQVVEDYPEDIRADNALFNLAELHEKYLEDTDAAASLYERLFLEFSGSTLAVVARKRFRALRGDFDVEDPAQE